MQVLLTKEIDYNIMNMFLERKKRRNTQVWLKGLVLKTRRSATAQGFESLFLRHRYRGIEQPGSS